nr:MAG TPA: hypothetical protein [Caudoviricetes sp.]
MRWSGKLNQSFRTRFGISNQTLLLETLKQVQGDEGERKK